MDDGSNSITGCPDTPSVVPFSHVLTAGRSAAR